jgi:uncharacterized protein (UPF0332 family)
MNENEVKSLLEKALQSIKASELLFNDNFFDFSAARSYYAMFYTIEALLLSRNLSYSKHSAVIGAFGKDFIKTGQLDEKYHRYILEALDLRNSGDYGTMNSIEKNQALKLISNAKELLSAVEKGLEKI